MKLFDLLGMGTDELSGLMKFEGPDPAFWCARGYAVCNPDPRGSYHSDGDIRVWSQQEGEDSHDLIEWLGVQDWCNGKVGTTGNSYLAISQWFAAAEQPSHLAAIAPWEGMSDVYRDLVLRGGIPDLAFARQFSISFIGNGLREDLGDEAEAYPLFNDVWKTHVPAFEKITVPAYIVASYSNMIHTPGTFRGWRNIASEEKWLRIHDNMEWPDYYEKDNLEDLARFFDHYLKDVDNGWQETPRVRYSVLDLTGGDRTNLPAGQFPPEDFDHIDYYLDAASQSLSTDAPSEDAVAVYDAESESGQAVFVVRVQEATDFVGYPTAHLWVEADGSDDMDLFVFLQKLSEDGARLEQFNVPNHGPAIQHLTQNGAAILKYKGSNGRLRVSMRKLDEQASTEMVPVHSFDHVEKLEVGQVVCVDVDLFPIGLRLNLGEQLRLVVSGHNVLGGAMPGNANVSGDNHGRHRVHTGASHTSFLHLPRKTVAAV